MYPPTVISYSYTCHCMAYTCIYIYFAIVIYISNVVKVFKKRKSNVVLNCSHIFLFCFNASQWTTGIYYFAQFGDHFARSGDIANFNKERAFYTFLPRCILVICRFLRPIWLLSTIPLTSLSFPISLPICLTRMQDELSVFCCCCLCVCACVCVSVLSSVWCLS